mgnify:CR=1 FL=1
MIRTQFVRRAMATLAILTGFAHLTGCDRPKPALAPAKPTQVLVTHPVVQEVTEYEDFTGRTEAIASVEIRARVTGYLKEVHFKDGADVQRGDLLYVIDPDPYQAAFDKAKASLALAKARLGRVEKDFKRMTDLASRTAVSQGELDLIAGEKAEAEAAVGVAQAELRLAQEDLGYTAIRAPISGRISRRLLDPGNLIQADQTILTTIVALDPINVYFDVDERTLLRLRRLVRSGALTVAGDGQARIQVALADEEQFSLQGIVDFVDNQLDPGTGTLRVRAEVSNPYLLLSPGLFVRVRFPVSLPRDSILIPEEAIGSDQGQKFVYTVNAKGEVEYRHVKIGQPFGTLRVVQSGLAATDTVIVSGMQRVRPGIPVATKPLTPRDDQVSAIDTTPPTPEPAAIPAGEPEEGRPATASSGVPGL